MEVIMNMKKNIGLSFVCCLVVLNGVILHSTAWGGCTAQERIELGKQGYDKGEVEKACADDGKNDGGNFWESITKDLVTGLASGLTDGLSKGLDKGLSQALGVPERNSTAAAPSSNSANACITNAGTCLLSGVPSGAPCYCQTWNGNTFYGIAK
jgi:hypothetical protein